MNNTKKKIITPLKDLNLSNRFLFDQVAEDEQAHRDMLEIIFGKEIPLLTKNETEKEFRVSPLIRSIRMDVCAMDEEKSIYNTEMQDEKKTDLAKRSRYYQSMMDTSLLEPGIPDYNLLNQSFIIMIMTFDLFGYKKYMYTFEPRCREVPECTLADGTTRIFLNTKGENNNEVSKELVDFLHYIENTTSEVAENSGSKRIQRIHDRVCKVKSNEKMGVKFMQAWEEKYYEHQAGKDEGLKEGRKEGRVEGLELKLIHQVCKKLSKNLSVPEIADMLEEDETMIQRIVDIAIPSAPDYDAEKILEKLKK